MNAKSIDNPLNIDISSMKPGLHYFNFRMQGDNGQWGGIARYMFFVRDIASETVYYEYWLDNDYEDRIVVEGASVDGPIVVDLNSVRPGLHYFNFRTQGDNGQWGGIARYMFFVKQATTELASINYWFDDLTDQMQTVQVTDSTVVITADISQLDDGTHTFCLQGVTTTGSCCLLEGYEFVKDSLSRLRTETVTAFSSPSFTVTLNPNRGTAQWFTNYYRLGNGGSLTLTGKSNVDNIVSVKMNLQDPARSGSGVRVSPGTLVGDSIIDVNATTLTITSTGYWPQLWLTSLDVTYEGTAPQGTYAILLPQYQANGTVTSSMDWADEGDVVTLTATPDEGYHLARLYANQGTVTISPSAEAANQYTFTMPAEDVTVQAVFAEGDITTGVLLNVPEDSEAINAPIYNLQGQRLRQLQRGINIIGGRKKVNL